MTPRPQSDLNFDPSFRAIHPANASVESDWDESCPHELGSGLEPLGRIYRDEFDRQFED